MIAYLLKMEQTNITRYTIKLSLYELNVLHKYNSRTRTM